MDNRKVNIILGLIAALSAVISVFILFATAFGPSDAASNPSTLGSCFDVAFGTSQTGLNAVPALIVAFVLQLVAVVFGLIGALLPSKAGGIALAIGALSIAVAGVFWIISPGLFRSANPSITPASENVVLGTGTILAAVFCFLSTLLGLYGASRAFKE